MKKNKHLTKTIDDFFKSINDGLNSPIPIEWVKDPNNWYGIFHIDDTKYEIFIKNKSDKEKHFLFELRANDKYDMVEDLKKAFTTIPTVEGAATDFIIEEKPEAFLFCALDDSASRKRKYDSFCIKIRKQFKYEYLKRTYGICEFYILASKSCDPEELKKSIIKISLEQKPR